ncbi:MAG: S8 family serine peptidase [Anaerolineae bacterium]|nr:S8 family serine peptidase [Anaerolineae bacterium]
MLLITALVIMAFAPMTYVLWAWPRPAAADSGPSFRDNEILVRLNPDSGATIADINTAYGTTTLAQASQPPGAYRLRAPSGQDVKALVATMSQDARLLYAQLNYLHEPPEANPRRIGAWGGYDPAPYISQYALAKLGILQAQALTQGEGVIVAVIDTGIQLDHPVFSNTLTTARKDFVDDDNVPGDDFDGLDNDGDTMIDEAAGHGTHIAGIVHLVAPKAKIMPLRVLDSDGHGDEFSVAEAIEFARENGAHIINLSLGSLARSRMIEEQIKDASRAGIFVVAAAGNLSLSDRQYPASNDCTLAVTSVGEADVKSDFSNFGDWVDVSAPGESIYSTFPISGYATWSGTSMSTPFVAGQAALLRSKNASLSPRQLAHLIAGSADSTDALNPTFVELLGHGRVNVVASLNHVISGTFPGDGNVFSGGCDDDDDEPTATPLTRTPTPTPSLTPGASPTKTPSPQTTPTGTPATPTPTPDPSTPSASSKLIARVGAMPSGTLRGEWMIGSSRFVANDDTAFDVTLGAFALGACVGGTYTSGPTMLLSKLERLESYKCQSETGGTHFGVVELRPPARAAFGTDAAEWRVGAITYTADANTVMAEPNGALVANAYVAVRYRMVSGTRMATRIETHIAPGKGPGTAVGALTTRPSDDWGAWVIGGVSYVGDHAIQVDLTNTVSVPEAGFAASGSGLANATRMVMVNYYTVGNQRYATWVYELPRKVFLPVVRK